MLRRVSQISAVHPEKIFLMAGINGLKGMSDEEFRNGYILLVDTIKKANPQAKLYIQSILPVNHSVFEKYGNNSLIEHANEIIKDIASVKGCRYIDLYPMYCINGELPNELTKDGIHLQHEAYRRWAKVIAPIIEQNNEYSSNN